MNVQSLLENAAGNALGNIFTDILLGFVITVFITRFFQVLTEIRDTIGALIILHAEIQVNKKMLEDLLENGVHGFEKEMERGTANEHVVDDYTFEDAAEFFTNISDNLLHNAFYSSSSALGMIKNKKLLEDILNLYTVGYHYKIQTGLKMKQLNWTLVDAIKRRLKIEIKNSDDTLLDIQKEIRKLKKINVYKETLNKVVDQFFHGGRIR